MDLAVDAGEGAVAGHAGRRHEQVAHHVADLHVEVLLRERELLNN